MGEGEAERRLARCHLKALAYLVLSHTALAHLFMCTGGRRSKKHRSQNIQNQGATLMVLMVLMDMWLRDYSSLLVFHRMHEHELELIQARIIQKPLLWVEVGKSVCVLVGLCELRLSLPARYDPHYPSTV